MGGGTDAINGILYKIVWYKTHFELVKFNNKLNSCKNLDVHVFFVFMHVYLAMLQSTTSFHLKQINVETSYHKKKKNTPVTDVKAKSVPLIKLFESIFALTSHCLLTGSHSFDHECFCAVCFGSFNQI